MGERLDKERIKKKKRMGVYRRWKEEKKMEKKKVRKREGKKNS